MKRKRKTAQESQQNVDQRSRSPKGGTTVSYFACIRSAPTANATIAESFSGTLLALTGATAVFTTLDWSPPRLVTVRVFAIPMNLTGHQADPNSVNNALLRNLTVN